MKKPHLDPSRVRSFFGVRILTLFFNWIYGRVVLQEVRRYAVTTEED